MSIFINKMLKFFFREFRQAILDSLRTNVKYFLSSIPQALFFGGIEFCNVVVEAESNRIKKGFVVTEIFKFGVFKLTLDYFHAGVNLWNTSYYRSYPILVEDSPKSSIKQELIHILLNNTFAFFLVCGSINPSLAELSFAQIELK